MVDSDTSLLSTGQEVVLSVQSRPLSPLLGFIVEEQEQFCGDMIRSALLRTLLLLGVRL